MSKDHTALPMQSLSIDEKAGHDPITGHRTPSVGTPGHSGMGAQPTGGILPGGAPKNDKKKIHPPSSSSSGSLSPVALSSTTSEYLLKHAVFTAASF